MWFSGPDQYCAEKMAKMKSMIDYSLRFRGEGGTLPHFFSHFPFLLAALLGTGSSDIFNIIAACCLW